MKHNPNNNLFSDSRRILILWLSVLLFAGSPMVWAATTIEPGTEKETKASGGTVANERVDGESYYINGTYIAGKGSMQVGDMTSKGFKIRTGQKSSSVVINVNYPYTITELTMTGIANYSAVSDGPCIKVSKVEVDGEEVLFTGGEFLAKETKQSATLSVSGISATDSIKLFFDNSNATGTQINMCYNIKWQRPSASEPAIQVTPKTLGLITGESYQASVKVAPTTFSTKWYSDNNSIATVDNSGVVKALSSGTVNIIHAWNDDLKVADTIKLKVTNLGVLTPFIVKTYDFTEMGDITLTISEDSIPVGYIYNAEYFANAPVYACTNTGLESLAVQSTLSEDRGWSIVADKGLYMGSMSGRCAAICDLKKGQIVDIVYTGTRFYNSDTDDGVAKRTINESTGRAIYQIEEDGMLGFELVKGYYVKSITIYEKKNITLSNLYYTLPEEDILYDGSQHAAKIFKSEGLGNIQIYYTNTSDGTKTDVAPSAAGTYTVSFECEGNDLYNEALFENVGTFSISNVNLQDWQILMSAYQNFPKTDQWHSKWDFSGGTNNAKNLYGVTFRKGQVTAINLASNNLSGDFPLSLLLLPSLQALNLSGNQITGDIGLAIAAFMHLNPTAKISVQEINVSNNLLSGNIGIFAHFCPLLTKLIASGNCIEDVYPMISASVGTLDIRGQTIARVVPIHLAQLDSIVNEAPSILLYNHAGQSFVSDARFQCYTQDGSWGMVMAYQDGQLGVSYVLNQNTYYGKSGDTLNVYALNGLAAGSTIRFTLGFEPGDCNFDGKVNIIDLQTNVLYVLENYPTRPYNFTAANLWEDEQINVQDVICLVNLLLENGQDEAANAIRMRRSAPYSEASAAFVYVENGKLMLNTNRPVAAFDITIGNANAFSIERSLQSAGMSVTTSKTANGIRLIGYSLNGASLPNGISEIGTLDKNTSYVRNAMLSDVDANAIFAAFGSTTGIDTIESTTEDDLTLYDLQGRKMQTKPGKGIYIQNGRKRIK